MTVNETALKQLVRQVLAEQSGTDPGSRPGERDPRSGVTCVRAAEVRPKPFATGKSGAEVYLSDVLTVAESPRLGCGVMEMHASSFPWTLKYDEIDYVIEKLPPVIERLRSLSPYWVQNKPQLAELGEFAPAYN